MDGGINISYDDPRLWKYTTIGDMAKDTRCLGYVYGLPVCADLPTPRSAAQRGILRPKPGGGAAITLPAAIIDKDPKTKVAQSDRPINDNEVLKKNDLNENMTKSDGSMCKSREGKVPYVVFANVGCTTSSYRIDVFTADAKDLTASLSNNDYIGEVTRIGMGKGVPGMGDPSQHGKRACRQPNATRVLSAKNVWAKRAPEQEEMKDVQIVVTDLDTWKKVEGVDIEKLPGFVPQVVWLPESS
jgi:tyrosinase